MADPHAAAEEAASASPAGTEATPRTRHRLLRSVDPKRDHVRGGRPARGQATVVIYGDYLCPYCRRLTAVLHRLRKTMGERLTYAYRHFPNERAHPGATLLSRAAEAAWRQRKFWEMHDALFAHPLPLDEATVMEIADQLGLDAAKFRRDLGDERLERHVEADVEDGRANGVTGTPTIFVDGVRYDGAWDFYSMLEALDRPVGARMRRAGRAFANLPASAGLVLLIAAAAAMVCANTGLAPLYEQFVGARLGLGQASGGVWLSVAEWCAEGLLAIFFLIVGLEIRREMTAGSLSQVRAAAGPIIAAVGGVLAPAALYLALNPSGPTAAGWAAGADTGLAFTLAVLAIFGARASAGLKVFIAAYAVVDDLISILILAVFYPRELHPIWLVGSAVAVAVMWTLNRWRIYAGWPYWAATAALWTTLHAAGVSGALAGVAMAAFLPTRPSPAAGPLLAQAATALAELEQVERELKHQGDASRRVEQEPVWDWAGRNLSAAASRLTSPAERIERGLAPWSTYVVLPLFAFTASGVALTADLGAAGAGRVLLGAALALAIGKPLGIVGATWAAQRLGLAFGPADASPAAFIGAACLCGIGDPLSILLAEQAFTNPDLGAAAKLGILTGSAGAAALGVMVLALSPAPITREKPERG